MLGTVGVVDATEWKNTYKDLAGYQMTSVIGKTGLEKAFESYLHGSSGSRTVETDLGGNEVAKQSTAAPRPGDNVVTTLDLDLQEVAERSLAENLAGNGRGGAAVALDPNTGEVLAMASYPTYSLADYNSTAAADGPCKRQPSSRGEPRHERRVSARLDLQAACPPSQVWRRASSTRTRRSPARAFSSTAARNSPVKTMTRR